MQSEMSIGVTQATSGVFGSPPFGTITTAFDPRVIQVAAKLIF